MDKYKAYLKAQITELLSNYGEISTLFGDIPPHYEDPSINDLVRSLQPNILINDRGMPVYRSSTMELSYKRGLLQQCIPITVLPIKAEILNDNSTPAVHLDIIPTFYQREDAFTPYLHIYNMPCESLLGYATVLKLTFGTNIDITSLFDTELKTAEARF